MNDRIMIGWIEHRSSQPGRIPLHEQRSFRDGAPCGSYIPITTPVFSFIQKSS